MFKKIARKFAQSNKQDRMYNITAGVRVPGKPPVYVKKTYKAKNSYIAEIAAEKELKNKIEVKIVKSKRLKN